LCCREHITVMRFFSRSTFICIFMYTRIGVSCAQERFVVTIEQKAGRMNFSAFAMGRSYTVKVTMFKADGMSKAVHRKFLIELISKEIMSVESIIRDIEKAIRLFAGRETFFAAVKKWKSDLVFLNEYYKRTSPIRGVLKSRNWNTKL